ncbi:MAG: chromosomal replication initiator protein DnaA [Actinomycetota bacterium]|nr:chromosomal replication initiator protein DnaA [Actinomycetota bacterium]
MCFESARPVALDDQFFVLSVANSMAKDRIENRHLPLLKELAGTAAGRPLDVVLQVDVSPEAAHPLGQDRSGRSAGIRRPTDWSLNPRYTFEAFVIGSSNRFPHAAALAVAEKPAQSYNPLFIYGDAGLGKTHLLHAICHYVNQNYPEMTVRYCSAEAFINEFIDSIRNNTQPAFKQRFRHCDVLLVDDIQFLEKKESTQEEFFHTFNALYEDNHQIVITSDRPPHLLATLQDRLTSRFACGLTIDIQPPELETRLAILRKKAEREPTPVPGNVLEYIAANITNNIRELEGALIRVCAYASLNGSPVTLDIAQEQLSDLISAESRQLTPRIILDATAEMFGLGVDELCGKSRSRPLVTARQIGMYVFRHMTDFSYPAIGREFGGRDHTTVMHAVDKIATLMKERRTIYDQVMRLMQILGSKG